MHGVRWSRYSEDTHSRTHLDKTPVREGAWQQGLECRVPESSAWLVGWLGLGQDVFGRLVNRNAAHTAALKAAPPLPGLRALVEAEPQLLPTCF